MSKNDNHDRGLFYAISLGLAGILFLALLWSGAFSLPNHSGGWVYEYQTLLSSIIAGGSIFLAWHNYNNTLKRKEYWARAHLPDALSDICRYTEECFHYILEEGPTSPKDCDNAVRDIKNAIEFVDEKSAETLFNLVSFYQTQKSRLKKLPTDTPSRLYDCVLLRRQAINLFKYARNEVSAVTYKTPTKVDMLDSLCQIKGIMCIADLSTLKPDKNIQFLMDFISSKHD